MVASQHFSPHAAPLGPPRRRKALWIALAAVAALLVTVVVALAATLSGGGGGPTSASDAVRGYLQALARGDAEAALSYGADQPASKTFLTDEILKKQIEHWPIRNVRILGESSVAAVGMASVRVAVKFGDTVSDTTLHLKQHHGSWKLETAAIKIKEFKGLPDDTAGQTLTLYGHLPTESSVYVFPGWFDIGSTNPNLSVTAKPVLLDQLWSFGTWIDPTFEVSTQGKDAIQAQVAAAFDTCHRSNRQAPPGCPMRIFSFPSDVVDGTVDWGRADTSALGFDLSARYGLMSHVAGDVAMTLTARTLNGGVWETVVRQYTIVAVDLSTFPPKVSVH
ncbi:hypothetical protein A5640_03340 [Mycobacterium asiaticum]|uniref:Uncharacterized protein n=1 Tax=Mycobacterium asiaticum TaxID=1790 RepID=A0A1A3KYS0_MYCAS|nr:hypothetical protein A5640_03340 [Mycobacterium asiaticum]